MELKFEFCGQNNLILINEKFKKNIHFTQLIKTSLKFTLKELIVVHLLRTKLEVNSINKENSFP